MRNKAVVLAVLSAALLSVSGSALAHHGAAGYDNSKLTVLKATITSFLWTNPHCEVQFDAPDDQGVVQHWNIEAPPPTMLVERGWNKKSLQPGDMVTMSFNAAKNGSHSGIMRKAVMANGDDLWAYPPPDVLEKIQTRQK
jgi:Family of unknown function (DUF6152)